jgi:hypothetical protein
MRKRDSEDGIVIAYLQSRKRGQTELACEALRAYYLPLALAYMGALPEEIHQAVSDTIAQLEAQMNKIKRAFALEGMAQVVLVQPAKFGIAAKPDTDSQATAPTITAAAITSLLSDASVIRSDSDDNPSAYMELSQQGATAGDEGKRDDEDDFFADDGEAIAGGAFSVMDMGIKL